MKLGSSTISRIGLGAGVVRGSFLGYISLTQAPDREPESDYRYYRWTITERKGYGYNLAVGMFELTLADVRIDEMDTATATNPGGTGANGPENALVEAGFWQDDNFSGGVLETFNGSSILLVDLGAAAAVGGYRWVTSTASSTDDPVSWTLERSNDLSTWQFVDVVIGATITDTRSAEAYSNPIDGPADAVNIVPAVIYQDGEGSFRKTATGDWLVESSIAQEWYVNGTPTGQTGDEYEAALDVDDVVTLVETAMPGGVTQASNALTVFTWDTSVTLIDAGQYATEFPAYTYTPTLTAPVFDVTDYGADPTGAKDSTYAINLARAARQAAGSGTVYIPAGTYRCVRPGTAAAPRYCFPGLYTGEVIEGDGPEDTILYFRAALNSDPASDTVFYRGGLFTTLSASNVIGSTPINNVTIRGFRATGNAQATNAAGGENEVGGSFEGWDESHKGIGIFNVSSTNWLVEYVEWDNWRGEQLYAGGDTELGTYTIQHTVCRGCNASTISMGGNIILDYVHVYAGYNGTECFARGPLQGSTVSNCRFEPQRDLPEGVSTGGFGIAYAGFPTSQLTVTDSYFGRATDGGIFLSEGACNVTIDNIEVKDTRAVYHIHLNQYPDDAANLNFWNDWSITNVTCTAEETSPQFAIGGEGVGNNWVIDNITTINVGAAKYVGFLAPNQNGPGFGDNIAVTNCTIDDSIPVLTYGEGPRVEWTDNTVTGEFELGSQVLNYDGPDVLTPMPLRPTWPRINVAQLGELQESRWAEVDPDYLEYFPLGWPLEIRRAGAGSGIYGVEIKPDATWNNLTRGYMIYTGGVLKLTMAANGKFDLTTWTPNTVSIPTWTQDGGGRLDVNDISMRGQLEVNLSPSVAHTFDTFSGVAIGETVTLNLNGNVTLEHNAGVIEMSNGVDYVSSGTVSLSATRAADGTLEVTIP